MMADHIAQFNSFTIGARDGMYRHEMPIKSNWYRGFFKVEPIIAVFIILLKEIEKKKAEWRWYELLLPGYIRHLPSFLFYT
jgi:hypothetical protein